MANSPPNQRLAASLAFKRGPSDPNLWWSSASYVASIFVFPVVSRKFVWRGGGIKSCLLLYPNGGKSRFGPELHYNVTCAPPDRILRESGAAELRRAPIGRYTWIADAALPMAGAARCIRGAAYAVPLACDRSVFSEASTCSFTEQTATVGSCHVYTSLSSTSSYTQYITAPQQNPHIFHKAHPPPAPDTSSTSRTCAPWAATPSPSPSRPQPQSPPHKPTPPPEPRR